ncbi:MAG TPA: GAP family protein [Ktedonobacteraceae bacterium]|nr:GAP family protein [Ktedonobacteraceae bacterium]
MGTVILQMLPLALGSIAPVMIGVVILFLSTTNGLAKSIAFVVGKFLAYLVWGFVLLALAGHIASTNPHSSGIAAAVLYVLLGIVLLIFAVKTFLGEDDPDAPPPKIMVMLDKLGVGKLFVAGFLLSIGQVRFIGLLVIGAAIITSASLSPAQTIICVVVLDLIMIWTLLIPIIAFVVMGERRDAAMKSMREWLNRHQRTVNVVVLGFFGIALLIKGLSAIFG